MVVADPFRHPGVVYSVLYYFSLDYFVWHGFGGRRLALVVRAWVTAAAGSAAGRVALVADAHLRMAVA